MKFNYDLKNVSNMGVTVKHGNFDTVVVFFDEDNDACSYRVDLFRADVVFEKEGFLHESSYTKVKFSLSTNKYREPIQEKETYQLSNPYLPIFEGNNLLKSTITKVNVNACSISNIEPNVSMERVTDENRQSFYVFRDIEFVSFDKVKFITSIECGRNNLYCKIDFLPIGQYFAVVSSEKRDGSLSKLSIPYYFKIVEKTNDKLIDSINRAGRAAAGFGVTI